MKKSQLKKIIRKEIITEIERPENEISSSERGDIEREAIKQISKNMFGKEYDDLYGREKLAAGRKFLNDSDKQKERLQNALKSLQDKGEIDPSKVYTAGTFYEGKINENRGQDAATELIAKLRKSLYRRLSDAELEAFKFEMIDHLGGTGGYIN